VSNERIQDLVANDELSRFQGAKTGRDHCEVYRYDNVDWESTDGPVVFMRHHTEGGDSGCRYYELDDDGAYIMGIHAFDGGNDEESKGNTMEHAENLLDIRV
jgi:hypothetical protein